MKLFSSLGRDIGIDIGTLHTHIYVQGRGVVLSEPSLVATDSKQDGIVAIGAEAERLILRAPDTFNSMRPLKDGFIIDYRVVLAMLKYFLHKASKSVRRARVILAVPCGITDVEARAITDAILQAGAREAYLLESPVAAALGCNLPVFEARGTLVVDIGGGTTDIAVMSLGGKVVAQTLRVGGSDLNKVILHYLRESFSIMVAEEMIEHIKVTLGSALPPTEVLETIIFGRDAMNGLTKRLVLRNDEVYEVLQEPISHIVEEVRKVVEQVSPELVADIMESGIVLTGAGALLHGLGDLIHQELGIPVRIANEPGFAVALGLGRAAAEFDRMERLIIANRHRKGNS